MPQQVSARNYFSYSFHPRKNGPDEGIYSRGYWLRHAYALSELAEVMKTNCWVPAVFKQGIKRNDSFLFADIGGFDFDNGKTTLEEACRYFAPYAHVIGTTKSHQKSKDGMPPCDRYRVAIMWRERILDHRTYFFNAKRIGAPLFADASAFRASQYLKPCKEIVSVRDDGLPFAVYQAPPPPKYEASPYANKRQVPPEVSAALEFGVAEKSRHDTIIKIALKLALCGFYEEETVAKIMNSELRGSRDAERTARDGWRYGASKNSAHKFNEGHGLSDDR